MSGRRLQYFIIDTSRQNEESIINRKRLQQLHVNERMKRDDAKCNIVVPTMRTNEELET